MGIALNWSDWFVAHDFFYALGGAERVTQVLNRNALPGSTLTYLGARQELLDELGLSGKCVGPWRTTVGNYRAASLGFPLAMRLRRPLDGNVLASSYAYSHHVRATGRMVVYCHSPLRQIWSGKHMYSSTLGLFGGTAWHFGGNLLRSLDRLAARRSEMYIANSAVVADRIKRFYGIAAAAVVPPSVDPAFDIDLARPQGDFYLWAGRIVEPYKRLGLAIEAFRGSRRRLVVAGVGRDAQRLAATAPDNVEFVGHKNVRELADLMRSARGLVFTSEDDFGLLPVESMSCGLPVIAFAGGGALETVTDGVAGVFFYEATVDSLRAAIVKFETMNFSREEVAQSVSAYSRTSFVNRIRQILS